MKRIFFLFASLFFFACSSDDEALPMEPNPNNCEGVFRLSKISENGDIATYFQYNSEGKVDSVERRVEDGGVSYAASFSYNENGQRATFRNAFLGDNPTFLYQYDYDTDGRLAELFFHYSFVPGTNVILQYRYNYYYEGDLLQKIFHEKGNDTTFTTDFFYSENNKKVETITIRFNGDTTRHQIVKSTDIENIRFDKGGVDYIPEPFLPDSIWRIKPFEAVEDYNYTFDNENRVIELNRDDIHIEKYEYECQ